MLLFHHTPAATLISTPYTAYTHTTQIEDVGGTRVCSCSVVLSTFAVNSGYCGLNFIGLNCCDVIHILRADTLYDVANILTRVLPAWASPHLLSLVTAVNLELSATLAGCFHFFFLRIGVLFWWLILTLHSKCGQLFHPNCALLSRRESSHLFLIPSSLNLHGTNISDITNQLIPIKIGEVLEEYIRVQNEPQRTRFTTSADKCKN